MASEEIDLTCFDVPFFTAKCPVCDSNFLLRPECLQVRSCQSGGIYVKEIVCPMPGLNRRPKDFQGHRPAPW